MYRRIFLLSIVLLIGFPGFIYGAVPAAERAALIAFYNSTNGDSWENKSGWKTPPLHTDGFALPGTEGNWYGVTVPGDHVTQIWLSHNNVTGSIPPELENLGNLEFLNIIANQLSGSIPAEIGNLSNLENLCLYKNKLSGIIPAEIGNLVKLEELSLFENQLSGSIPAEIGNLSQLKVLILCDNRLSGSIPQELGNLGNLQYLYLYFNQLSGSIPTGIGNLVKLEELFLFDNQLSGSIPSTLGNLVNLERLDLDNNKLSGEIPFSITNLTKIYWFDISYNCLYTNNPVLISWLNTHAGGWNLYQDQCGGTTPSITVTCPNGGESWYAGSSQDITWTSTPNIKNVKIEYSIDNGTTWSIIDIIYNEGFYTWDIPDVDSSQCLVRVLDAYDGEPWDTGDAVFTIYPLPPAEISLSRSQLYFSVNTAGTGTTGQKVRIDNSGGRMLNWSANTDASWLGVSPTSGSGPGVITISINAAGQEVGDYTGMITVSDPDAVNSPQAVSVSLKVYKDGETQNPFGDFAAPRDGTTVSGSIPVTGWVLDDIEVMKVEIFSGEAYVGDAVFVEGARPDVELAYPGYPKNYRAGWGYMLLTNFLPGGGNGTYTVVARVTDAEGHQVTLGTKTIIVDNAHAVKPFGTIDTPGQGGTAAGIDFINWGWVLTPLPNTIPKTGQTIDVYVDGAKMGHPVYNIYRPDVASLFPGYSNSGGAAGYYYIHPTFYANGLHTISWVVTDDAGNTDGIGSRYFSIENLGSSNTQAVCQSYTYKNYTPKELELMPVKDMEPIKVRRGFGKACESQEILPGNSGAARINLKELEPIEIHLGENMAGLRGYMVVEGQLRDLPIGSTLEVKTGKFYWIPGPGYLGTYELVFVIEETGGQCYQRKVEITVEPKFTGFAL
jgi:hypothetical protein